MSGETGDDCAAVLLVGAKPRDARIVSCGLGREDISVDVAADIRAVIDRLTAVSEAETDAALPSLVALDFTTDPDDSLTVLNAIRSSPRLKMLPAVALVSHTVADDEARERIQQAYRHGVNGHVAELDDTESYADAIQEMAAFWFDQVALPPKSLYFDGPSVQYD